MPSTFADREGDSVEEQHLVMWNSTPNSGTVEPQVKMLWAWKPVKVKVNPSDTSVDSLGGHWIILGGGFKYFLFSSLFGEDFQFD